MTDIIKIGFCKPLHVCYYLLSQQIMYFNQPCIYAQKYLVTLFAKTSKPCKTSNQNEENQNETFNLPNLNQKKGTKMEATFISPLTQSSTS